MFIGAPGTTVPGTGARIPYAICGDPERFTGVPTADTKGPPIGCPMEGAAYIPAPGIPAVDGTACLTDLFAEFPEEPFV